VILAHHPVALDGWWAQWTFEPATAALIAAAAVLYGVGRGRLRRRGRAQHAPSARATAFYAGLALLALALLSPIHALGETLFSAHMVQHLLLILGVAPLLVYGAPLLPVLLALPPAVRRDVGVLRHAPLVGWSVRTVMHPLVVWGLHALVLWTWHLPGLYRAALEDPLLHVLEHSSLLLTAIAFWYLVMATGARRRLALGPAVLFVFTTGLQSGALGALLTFASRPLYPLHVHGARAWGVTPLADQELAGLIMWIPAGAAYLVAMAALLLAWLKDLERTHPGISVEAGDRA
jgi:cytochrome c oxidase assembly factor CtaG